MNSQLIVWTVKVMATVFGLDAKTYAPHADETVQERETRYTSIATDLYDVVNDEDEAPLYDGKDGRIKTALTLLSIASFESGFRKDVDLGLGTQARGDHGRSVCLAQINVGGGRIKLTKTGIEFPQDGSGYSASDIINDRKVCFRIALHIARMSFACGNSEEGSLQMYASGKCDGGAWESRNRIRRAMKWYGQYQETMSNQDSAVNEKDESGK